MGRQLVKQPNGQYAIWSSVVDDFIIVNATLDEIIADEIAEASKRIHDAYHETAEALECGEKPSYQFTMSFKECVSTIKRCHGKKAETLQILGLVK